MVCIVVVKGEDGDVDGSIEVTTGGSIMAGCHMYSLLHNMFLTWS